MSFERLSPELHLIILNQCPDVQTLLTSIFAIPQLRRLYRPRRHEILTAVVQNQFAHNFPKVLSLLDSAIQNYSGQIIDRPLSLLSSATLPLNWHLDSEYLTIKNVKRLLELDASVNHLIRECVHLQFGAWVPLTTHENMRFRRGMYNFIHAAILSRNPPKPCYIQSLIDFYEQLSTMEIFEVLYMSHCLQSLAKDFLRRLSNFLFDQIVEGFIIADFQREDRFFGCSAFDLRERWCKAAPWMMDIAKLNYLTTTPIGHLEFYRFHYEDVLADSDSWTCLAPHGHFDPMEDKLKEHILYDHDHNYSGPGAHYFDHGLNAPTREDLIASIPNGFMIWDETHWKQLQQHERHSMLNKGDIEKCLEQKQRCENEAVQDRARKWSWSVYGTDYPSDVGRRKHPRGSPRIIESVAISRRRETWLIQTAADFKNDAAYQKPDKVKAIDDCDGPYRIDWKNGTLFSDRAAKYKPRATLDGS